MQRLRLPATIESLEKFRSFVMGTLREAYGLERLSQRVDLALEEVLVNVISYAYTDGGSIEVECHSADPARFCLTIRDWGIAFNPLDRAEPDMTRDIVDMEVGGLGIHLIRQMVTELSYERHGGVNTLRLIFEIETA